MRKLLLNPTPLFRKLRQLSLLLSLLLVPQLAGAVDYLTIAGIQVTDANASNITGTGITAGTVTFNPSDYTLTLDNARVNGTVSTSLTTLRVHLKGHSIFNVTTDGTNKFYLFNGATTLHYSAENFGDVLEGIGTTNDYTLEVAPSSCTENYDGSVVFWKNSNTNINNKCYCKLSKPYLFVGDNEEVDKSNYNSDTRFSFDAANSSLTFSATPNSSNNNAFLVKSNIANLTVNITNNIIYGLDNNNTTTGKAFIYTGNDNSSTLTLNIAEGKTLKVQWSNTSTGNKDWINQGFSNTNISYDLSTMGSSDVYGEEVQASLLYSIIFSNVEKYGLTIAGTPVTSTNASSITGTGISGTVSFDATNKILTLNGATIEGTIESSLAILSIHLTGNNSIRGNTTALLNGIKSTNGGTLTFTADANAALTITTTGDAASAVTGFANVTLGTGAYLQTDIPTKYDTNGKNFCWQVSSANIVKELVITSAPCYPLWIGNTQFTSTSTPTGFSFDATNNILTLTNVTQANPLISGLANLTIALSGDNSITKSDSSAVIRSINSQAALIIQKAGTGDGSLYLENNGSDPSASPVVKNFASINHTGLNYSSKSGSSINGASTHDAILSSATIYPLWIAASKPVTASTTSGTGWSYDAANNKLSLNNATINGSIISGLGDLTIDIQGTNIITVSDTTAVIRSTNAGKLTISKTGATPSLRLQNTFNDSYPIYHCPVIKDFASFELSEGLYLSNAKSDGDFGVPALYESFGNLSSNGGNSTMGLVNAEQSYSWQPRGIRDVTISTDVYYPIWVAHHRENVGSGYNIVYTQITPTNKDDFLGDGVPKVSFIPASASNENINTLKLNEAAITDAIFSNLANLTIEFSGTNTLCDNGKTTGYIHGADPNAIITFKALADNSSISLDCANDHAVVEGFANVAFDKAVAEYTGRFSYDTTERKYKNNYGDLQTLFIKTPTPPTMSYNSQEKVTLEKSYPDGDIYYTITYADGKTTDVAKTKYTAEFAMDAPGTVETWVEANGATTSSVKGKHFGYQEAQFSLLEQEELTPVLIPAIETGDNIDYATAATRYAIDDANVATIDNNGKITALAIGTATLTTQLAYASNLPLTTTILNYDEKFTTQLTVSKVFNVTFAEGANYMIYYNSAHNNLTIPDGMTAAIVTGVSSSGTTVETTTLSYIPETTAVLLGKGTSTGTPTITLFTGTLENTTANKLKYVDNNPVTTTGYEYVLYKDEFVKATGSIPDGKCYLDLTGAAPAPAPARSLGIDNDGTTDIRELRMENEERDEWYDLQGRRIEQPTKAGLYIKNGKKVIVNTK